MRQDMKSLEETLRTTAPEERLVDEGLHEMVHDVQSCLHVIGLGTELLQGARNDDVRFEQVCQSIDFQRREAVRLLSTYLRSTLGKDR